ncbi:hypothetical protein A2U01_0061512, partial [Trifolium medium]|nr:hypothetical protein [Trifolium medium]
MVERCNRKRLTLTPDYDPRIVDHVVNEMVLVLNALEEEFFKAEEKEKNRLEEEENRKREEEKKNRIEEEEKMRKEDQLLQLSLNIAPEAKGKEIVAEPHPLVLVLQEKLEAQG